MRTAAGDQSWHSLGCPRSSATVADHRVTAARRALQRVARKGDLGALRLSSNICPWDLVATRCTGEGDAGVSRRMNPAREHGGDFDPAPDRLCLINDIAIMRVAAGQGDLLEGRNVSQLIRLSVPTIVQPARPVPPVNPKKTVSAGAIISLEDGKPYKSLKRHLGARGLTPDEYRTKWGLPVDYPMVAANYSAARSELAKTLELGKRRSAKRQRRK